LEVVHEYITATQALANGHYDEALQGYSKVLDVDENFAMAYRGMAFAYQNQRKYQDAEKYIKLALGHIDRMTERERYRTRASYYALLGNYQKCIEEYGALISRYPSDSTARNNLAYCSTQLRDMTRALEQVRQAAAIFPKRPSYRVNMSLYASYGSDFQTGEREARTLLGLEPSYTTGFMALAFAQLGQGQMAQAAETYQQLAKVSKVGASNSEAGLADLALYEGRFADAARILEEAANVDLDSKSADDAATKFAVLAQIRLLQGQTAQAIAAVDKALAASKAVKVRFLAGRVLAAAGQAARAKKLADDLATELPAEPRSYAKLIEGVIALANKDGRQAINLLRDANSLLDTWISRFDLGRAYLEAGAFPEADSEFDQCINKRRGEALALFLDESPTYGYFPLVYYYQGRVRDGLKSPGAAESYRTYLSIRGKAGEDPLLPEVRKRAGK
jgi:tetratricopeptide (TPR) repeat protein